MDYQPGPRPGQTSCFIPPTPPPPILQPTAEAVPYDHSRYRMVILTILSLAEVIVPHLGAYCPSAADMLYLSHSLHFWYWALVSRYPDGWTPTMAPWYGTTPGHDKPPAATMQLSATHTVSQLVNACNCSPRASQPATWNPPHTFLQPIRIREQVQPTRSLERGWIIRNYLVPRFKFRASMLKFSKLCD
ncbi:hypothetical protein DSO57_1036333 [Entomophthora muscae]|uniref:Uncharacterized protein n=1 Tax=Entomophthora muscae TaxID=34485 RepID=A0ACC2TA68_9FUNG|nr:hypothetical protein DSO57_1036333 [Entomophthora muscae]